MPKPSTSGVTCHMGSASVSASAKTGITGDLNVKSEKPSTREKLVKGQRKQVSSLKIVVEPLIRVHKMSDNDIAKAKQQLKRKAARVHKPTAKPKVVKPKPKGKFHVATHQLAKRKRKYYYKCKVGNCNATFNKTKSWNAHHLVKHRDTTFRCGDCRKVLRTPPVLRTIWHYIENATSHATNMTESLYSTVS